MLSLRPRFITPAAVAVAFFLGVWIGKYFFEPTEQVIPNYYFEQMSLLTWKGWSGDLCFLLVPMMQRSRAGHDFWSKWRGRCGSGALKEALLAVPRNQYVYWNDWPPKFTYPDDRVVQEILEFAKANDIHLEESPSVQ
jgi:hypothetical protein